MLGNADRKRKFPPPPVGNGGHLMMMPHMQQAFHQPPPPMSGIGAGLQGSMPGGCGPSCVLFVSEIPPNTCELELKRAFQEFGKLEQIVTMPAKQQALIEFLRLADAERLVAMHQSGYAVVANGGTLALGFWNRPKIDMLQESYLSATPQNCLLLTIYNVRLEFNCDSIRQICSPYGLVDRCLIIRQVDGLLRAILEFEKLEDAVLTKPHINGANMYAGCNAIRCEYARPSACEYFASRETVIEEFRYDANVGHAGAGARAALLPASSAAIGGIAAAKRPRMPPHSNVDAAAAVAGLLMQQQLQQQHHHHPAGMLQHQLQQPPQHQHQPKSQHQQQAPRQSDDQGGETVLVIRGMSPQMNCDRLFNILSLYGNVGRVKFITSKEGFALVQMLDVASAQQAVSYLHGQTILGSTLKVTHSDQGAVKRGLKEFALADGTPAEKSFDAAKLNRFMSQEAVAKNQASLGRTGRVLYYWGCPDGTTEASIKKTLQLAGASVPQTVTTQGEKGSTGWITFASVTDATDAICLANHAMMGESARMKLSYAVKK